MSATHPVYAGDDHHRSPLDAEGAPAECPRCGKRLSLCVCDGLAPIDNKIALLILQHPQEQDKTLGTARLTALHFTDATLKIGLSWASLAKALGRPADPQRWAILYLGSARAAALAPDADVVAVDRKGEAEDRQQAILQSLEGVVLLDGTWSQAKALWWRNPWMLKCRRIILNPSQPSRYGKLRREPRSDGLSTIESAAMVMSRLEKRAEIETALLASFDRLLERYRELQKASPAFDRAQTRQSRAARTKRRTTDVQKRCAGVANGPEHRFCCERQRERRDRCHSCCRNSCQSSGIKSKTINQSFFAMALPDLQVFRRFLAAVSDNFVFDLLALIEGAQASALNRRDVHEHILAARLRLDESVALRRVEPLHSTGSH